MSQTFLLHDVGRLPAPGDNVAIAVRSLEAGTVIELDGAPRTLAQHILEGHRFAIRAIAPGEALLFMNDGRDLVTSPIERIERPSKEIVAAYGSPKKIPARAASSAR